MNKNIIIIMNNRYLNFFKKVIINFSHHKVGRCNICGHLTVFFLITDINQARGDFICIFCRSFSRKRHVAKLINELVSKKSYITDILQECDIHIYNTDTDDAFYKVLCGYEYYICSELFSDVELGAEIRKNVFCQDIEDLTFPDGSFDLVITEDIFEHVKNYKKGFKEINRVLKKGGYHIFTIPFSFDKNTINRIDTFDDNEIHILPPEYHNSRRGKVIVYRTFGIDLFDFLDSIGFETNVYFSGYSDQNYNVYDSSVFVSRKL